MIEPRYTTPLRSMRKDLRELQERTHQQRQRYKQCSHSIIRIQTFFASLFSSPMQTLQRLPSRYVLHLVVALIVPLALAFSQLSITQQRMHSTMQPVPFADRPAALGPLSFDADTQVGDLPLNENDIPMPISLVSRSEALAPVVVPGTIAFDRVKVRNGPGLEYDDVERMVNGTPVKVIGRHGEWFKVQGSEEGKEYWIASELVTVPDAAFHTLFEVPEENIPAPPPPKIGTVVESNLNLRDGPGTHYVSMHQLESGTVLSLVEQYQDWLHVASDDYDGWVKSDFLEIAPGIIPRVHKTNEIPDPNPPLIGAINDWSVNLRKGPGQAYHVVSESDVDTPVDLLAQHKDWFKVQLSDGTKAWVFSDLINMSPMVRRRVPYTNNIPALPQPVRVARNTGGGGTTTAGTGGTTSNTYSSSSNSSGSTYSSSSSSSVGNAAAYIPASGDVAGYAMQFVGYRYVYGGASPGSGFDCSGLVQYVYGQYGIYLPHNAAAQFSTAYGASVGSMSNLAPGDLMFFAGTAGPGISHVSIYIGGGRMVHAMTPSLGVGVSSIWDSYWVSHYYGAIRVGR